MLASAFAMLYFHYLRTWRSPKLQEKQSLLRHILSNWNQMCLHITVHNLENKFSLIRSQPRGRSERYFLFLRRLTSPYFGLTEKSTCIKHNRNLKFGIELLAVIQKMTQKVSLSKKLNWPLSYRSTLKCLSIWTLKSLIFHLFQMENLWF